MLLINIFCLFLIFKVQSIDYVKESEIFYQSPILNIKYMNVTFGITSPDIKSSPYSYAGGQIAAICQADKLSRGAYPPINFTGLVNLIIQYFDRDDPVGQNSAIRTLSNSLYNKTTNTPLSSEGIENLAGFIGSISSGENRINAAVSSGFALPFINPGTLNLISPSDRFTFVSKAESRSFYSIRDTFEYSDFNVLLNLMQAYNWTIGANLFENNVFGFTLEQQVQAYASENSSPIFTCNEIIALDNFDTDQFYTDYCNCMTNINKLNLLSLWMSPIFAYKFIKEFKKKCKAAENFVYVVPSESEPFPSELYYDDSSFKSVFIIRSFGGLNFSSFLSVCLDTSSQSAINSMNLIKKELFLNIFFCVETTGESSDLIECKDDIFNRTELCICTGTEFDPEFNQYSVITINILISNVIIFLGTKLFLRRRYQFIRASCFFTTGKLYCS
jgi:hypothetical protein